MLNEKIKALEAEIRDLETKFNTDLESANKLAEDGKLEEVRSLKKTLDDGKKELAEKRDTLADLKSITEQRKIETGAKKEVKTDEHVEQRDLLRHYIASKGEIRAGLTTVDNEAILPKDIVYSAEKELKTVVDLRQFVDVIPVTTMSGTYPVLENVSEVFPTVEELEKNPELAKPKFNKVDYKIQTRRGALAISQEDIDDAVNVDGIVADQMAQRDINTSNAAILEKAKTMTAKKISSFDDVKQLLNVELDPAYSKAIVASQTFFNWLDTLKDNNGRYLLQDSITSASGKVLSGNVPVAVVPDTQLGKQGDSVAFVGDLKRAVKFFDRKQLSLRWMDNDIYGQYLAGVMRFDTQVADTKAGFFVTQKDVVTSPASK
ncbi:phage major capsid protein [Latilactobacillus curvatus]|uniref:Phage major capsid protein n=1 Tax=Latilactobacillus curvatus TaxID=28038 RepID=A0A385ACR3_LATCU|nr:phage major capsid protein [Latilactobacillus curvatus]AXN35445.1 phage major capsid protein [Latilactobacillus curvatus]